MKAKADLSSEFIVSGTVESGKTRALLHRLYELHCLIPNLITFITRKQKTDMRKSVLDQFEKEVLPYHPGHPLAPCKAYGGAQPTAYYWNNGGVTYIFGIEEVRSVLGAQFDAGFVCQAEQLTLSDWEFLSHRCGRAGNWYVNGERFGQIWGDANPDTASHWIPEREKQGKLVHYKVTFDDNILFFKDGKRTDFGEKRVKLLENTLTGVNRRRLILGEWCSSEGLVFPNFDQEKHVLEELPEWVYNDPKTEWYLGIDHGHSAPFIACWFAYNKEDDIIISVKEWRMTNTLILEHITKIKEHSKDEHSNDLDIVLRVSDWDAQMNHELQAAGIGTENANKDKGSVLRGIDQMRIRLSDGRLFLYKYQLIERDPILEERQALRDGIEEMENYHHKPVEKHIGDSTKDDLPVKGNDHWIDTCRYVIDKIDNRIVFPNTIGSATPNYADWNIW